jgi:DNA-binding NtrC family response regulator
MREGINPVATILVVDDEDVVRNALYEFFAGEHTCHAAGTAEEALTYLSVQQYDVVVTDYSMPGLSGLDLLANIRQTQPDTPVILISGLSAKERAPELIAMGAFDYLVKPFRLKDVEMCLTRAIAHHERSIKSRKEDSGVDHDAMG